MPFMSMLKVTLNWDSAPVNKANTVHDSVTKVLKLSMENPIQLFQQNCNFRSFKRSIGFINENKNRISQLFFYIFI